MSASNNSEVINKPPPLNDETKNEDFLSPKRQKLSEQCKFFVHRKKRFCKMLVKDGAEYCGEHKKLNTEESSNDTDPRRIICPLDNKHTCYAHKLEKHLKICNARPKPMVSYIVKGINTSPSSSPTDNSFKPLSTFSIDKLNEVIKKVNEIYEKLIESKLSEKYLSHKLLEEELLNPSYGFKTQKHLKQVSSILALIEDYQMNNPNTCFIEFGAGRGQLSFWLATAIAPSDDKSKVLLIERASPKHKKDNKLAKTSQKVSRIRADISDLVLDKVDSVKNSLNIIGVTKHLCGEATDLAIRCLANMEENKEKLAGCILTFCCHHRCRWPSYTGKTFFKENGMDKEDFDALCGIASWATCGSGLSRKLRKETDDTQMKQNERDVNLGLSRQEKEEIGRRSKNVLNWGRLDFLEKLNFKCKLHYYVDKQITLENVCIVASK